MVNRRTSKEDDRASELIRQEIEDGIDTLTNDDFEFRERYWQRPLTEIELDIMRKRLDE